MNLVRIDSLNADEVSVYVGLNEKQLKRYYEPDAGIFICESIKVIQRALSAGYEALSFFIEETKTDEVADLAPDEVPIYAAAENIMQDITGYSLTGGVLAAMRRKNPIDVTDVTQQANNIVILDDIENPTNVGAIFRSAAALGADAILLTEGCSDPLYRRAARVSMGTVFQIDWTYIRQSDITLLKDEGYAILSLSLGENSVQLQDVHIDTKKRAIVLGNEENGISEDVLDMCDINAVIPMKNGVDSLNVAAASAVAFWELF